MYISCNYTRLDFIRRHKYNKQEAYYLMRKSIFLNQTFPYAIRSFFFFQKNLKVTRIRNRCRLSGKSRTVFKLLGLSRMPFRYFMSQRLLSGIKRLSR